MAKNDQKNKLIIWEVCSEADRRNIDFYDRLDDEQKKSLAMYPFMRWMSSVDTRDSFMQEYYIQMVNSVNIGFWDLSAYPEVQWKLLANCGIGTKQKHSWISRTKGTSRTPKIDDLLFEMYPSANYEEIEIVKSKLTKDGLKDICRRSGLQDAETKKYLEEYKKIK